MIKQMFNHPLDVIGFNALFNDLHDIDHVEAALYRGDTLTTFSEMTASYAALFQQCATFIVEANKLTAAQFVVILVDENSAIACDKNTIKCLRVETVKSVSMALSLAAELAQQENIACLIFAVSLPGIIHNNSKSTISFDASFESYAQRQGAACLLVADKKFTQANNAICYATIDNMLTGTDAKAVINQTLQVANINASDISTLEVSACADRTLNEQEQSALLATYARDKKLSTAISCHKSVLGENGVLSELMAIIHSTISLQQRYRPAIKDWLSPTKSKLAGWLDSCFYVFNQAAPVFPKSDAKPTVNAVSLINDHSYSHLILRASPSSVVHQNGFNCHGKQTLFIFSADNEQDLRQKLEKFTVTNDFKESAKQLYQTYKTSMFIYKAVLIAASIEELNREITLALDGIKTAFSQRTDWKTPKGSYFTTQLQATDKSKTAFLYPGIGATYVGMGRELFHLFPEIYPSVIALAGNIGASLKDELLNPRSVVSLDFKQLKQHDLALRNSLANIAECGVGYACVFTKIFELVFKLKADFASGYSMGEVSMFAALGCWQTPGLMSARLANSDTFNHQLSSELRAIRKLWRFADIKDGQFEPIWETYSIKGDAETVNNAIKDGERVYVTIINTPDSLTIGGFPDDCLKVIKRLGVRAMPLHMANAIHSEPAYQEYDKMIELYTMDVTKRIQTKMLSSSCYLLIPQHPKAIAVSIAKCLCEPVDFPRLINTLTEKEVTLFIEMGAGRSLCSWTDKILKDNKQHHMSVPVNAKGTDDQLTYARAVAKLISVGKNIDIESFFSGSIIKQVS